MKKEKKFSFFNFLEEINYGKKNIYNDETAKDYLPFMINRGLSYFNETIHFANTMNKYHFLDKDMQFTFLINTIRKRKRYSNWFKPESDGDIEVIKEYYGYSNDKARQVITLFTPEQLRILKEKVDKGGRK